MKTAAALLCSFDEFDAMRPRPLNEEHAEAFMTERYLVAGQLFLLCECGFSQEAVTSYPIIENKDYSLRSLRRWSVAFESWRQQLRRRDARILAAIRFSPERL